MLDHQQINEDYHSIVKNLELKEQHKEKIKNCPNLTKIEENYKNLITLKEKRIQRREIETFKKYSLVGEFKNERFP